MATIPPQLQEDVGAELLLDDSLMLLSFRTSGEEFHQQFTRSEWLLVKSLVASYPQSLLHEQLYAAFCSTSVEESRRILQQAKNQRRFQNEIGRMHDALYRAKPKLRTMHLTI